MRDSKKMNICILGDKNVGKTTLIQTYVESSGDKNLIVKGDYKKFEKIVGDKQRYKINLHEFNEKNDKIISTVQDSQGVFVLFDMNIRESFENLLDNWLTFLRDDCNYSNPVIILGNYAYIEGRSVLTSVDEINDMIKMSGIDARFHEIGNLTKENVIALIDNLIEEAYEAEKKSAKTGGSKDQSLKKCEVY